MPMVVAEGSIGMIRGRYMGWAPNPMVAVDIFSVENGRLLEHWDVMQAEVHACETASRTGMFMSAQ
jgi:predicted SnoaL-like aldol condensation-catalyzing enzyme